MFEKGSDINDESGDLGPAAVVESGRSNYDASLLQDDLRPTSVHEIVFERSNPDDCSDDSLPEDNCPPKKKFSTIKERYGSVIFEYDTATYPPDSYSFLSLHGPKQKPLVFGLGMLVFLTQISFLGLIIMSKTHPTWKSGTIDDNKSEHRIFGEVFATNSTPLVQGAQVLCMFSYLFFADSSVEDIIAAAHFFPRFDKAGPRDKIGCMVFSCCLRLLQGILAMVGAIILVITSDDVIDIILNFTALNFISSLDDVAFRFAKSGKYGPDLEAEAKIIEELPVPICMFRKRGVTRYRLMISGLGVVTAVVLFLLFYHQGRNKEWDTQVVRIEFGGENRVHSGCYEKKEGLQYARRDVFVRSRTAGNRTANFGFCVDDKRWVMYEGNAKVDPCKEAKNSLIIVSSKSDSFDISPSLEDNWYTPSYTPADVYFFEGNDRTALFCDQFLNNGICDEAFNNQQYQYDSGDCCAATCSHPACYIGGLKSAFGSNIIYGEGYSHCKDPAMKVLRIKLNNFRSSRHPDYMNLTKSDEEYKPKAPSLLSLYCDKKKVLKVNIDNSMENQTVDVRVSENAKCELRIGNATNSHPQFDDEPMWYVNYTVYHYLTENTIMEDPTLIVEGDSYKHGSFSFKLMNSCYYDKLEGHIDRTNVYEANDPSSKAIDWLMKDESEESDCELDQFISRYALSALNFAAPIVRTGHDHEHELWINYINQCFWPNFLCSKLDRLQLDLSNTSISGQIATEIGLLSNLERYDASDNDLRGSIPTEIGMCGNLRRIKISNNALTGSIPTEIKNITNLSELRLGGNILTGSIPSEIGLMTSLTYLDLSKNGFTGYIPSEIGLLTSLIYLDLGQNSFNGYIPSELGLLTSLIYLDLGQNSFDGYIPSEIRKLTELIQLRLEENHLTGSIPSEVGLLTSLTMLSVGSNSLTGTIPTELGDLTALENLFMDDVSIPKYSVPTSLMAKVAEPCFLCDSYVPVYSDDEEVCPQLFQLLHEFNRIAIDKCEQIKEQCSFVCNGAEEIAELGKNP